MFDVCQSVYLVSDSSHASRLPVFALPTILFLAKLVTYFILKKKSLSGFFLVSTRHIFIFHHPIGFELFL